MKNDFAIFILTYNRPKNIPTIHALEESRYSGKWYLIVGDDDPALDAYIKSYKDRVVVFNKDRIAAKTDLCDSGGTNRVVIYARNYCWELAKQLGLKYFLQLDDDYKQFIYRYIDNGKLKRMTCYELDEIIQCFIEYLKIPSVTTVAFSQCGDFIGGSKAQICVNRYKRKAMNSFFCKVSHPFMFLGRINEDVNTYLHYGKTGNLFLTLADMTLDQELTQKQSGGMTDVYNNYGTYYKSFYSVMIEPSCTSIFAMDTQHSRLHHRIDWNKAVPKILDAKYCSTGVA